MLKVYLFKVSQKGWDRYLGKAPGRLLAKLCKQPEEMNAPQEAQRPLEEKRLKELAKFANDEGVLATSVVLGTTSRDAVEVKDAVQPGDPLYGKLFSIKLPESEAEINAMGDKKIFKIIDGQHRLFSFLDNYCLLPEDTDFELSFEMYLTPEKAQQETIFANTNEYQKPVPPTLLLYFRNDLGLLTPTEDKYYHIVELLSSEASSPLCGRIQMSAEKIKYPLKAKEIIVIFNDINLKGIYSNNTDDNNIFRSLITYLSSWEKEVGSNFTDLDVKHTGSFCKISGFRFIMYLFPTFTDLATRQMKYFDETFIREQIKKLFNNNHISITPSEFFDPNSTHNKTTQENKMFGGKTPTKNLADKYREWLLEANAAADSFDIFGSN